MPVPMPNSAVPIGRPIAITEPNAISRMTIAARSPMASLTPLIGFVANMSPPYSIFRPGDVDCVAQRLDLLAGVEEILVGAVGEVDLGVGDVGIVGPDLAGAFRANRG